MPFKGDAPYGTVDDADLFTLPQSPPDVRVATEGAYGAFLLVNGPITVRNREQIEAIVRTLGARGESQVTILVRDDGAIIDNNTSDLNFTSGLQVIESSPGVVVITIPSNGISTAMLADAIVTSQKIAANAITNSHIADNTISGAKIGNATIDAGTKLGDATVSAAKLVTDSIGTRALDPNSGMIPVFAQNQTLRSWAGSGTVLSQAKTLQANVLYNYFFVGVLHGEGVGAYAQKWLAIQVDGGEFAAQNVVWEQGVNSGQPVFAAGQYNPGATTNRTAQLVVSHQSGTVSEYSSELAGFWWPAW